MIDQKHERLMGPLDSARVAERIATNADIDAALSYGNLVKNNEHLEVVANQCNRLSPFIGRQVIVEGTKLESFEVDDETSENDTRIGTFWGGTPQDDSGEYQGYEVVEVRESLYGAITIPRLAHKLLVGTEVHTDPAHNKVTVEYYDYYLAYGSNVQAIEPIDAHSLEDLRANRLVAELDEIIYDEDSLKSPNYSLCLQRIAKLINTVCKRGAERTGMLHQQLSYVNATNFLKDSQLLAKDVFMDIDEEMTHADPAEQYIVRGDTFIVAPAIYIKNGQFYPVERQELYARGNLESYDDKECRVPVRTLLNARSYIEANS
jgi:hypothetical protein